VLLTEDKDFGELVYRRGLAHAGVVLVRLAGIDNATKAATVSQAFQEVGDELIGAFTVISADAVRVRRPTS
jgi:predicted nuclease of predicted toxin-antitoxin system